MINLTGLMLLETSVPQTVTWSFNVALVMIIANVFAIIIGRFAIKNAGNSQALPFSKPGLWKNFGIAELLATTSFGHILGAGLILGLSNAGLL
jgi:photosystem I subunit 10